MQIELHTRRPFRALEEDVGAWRVLRLTGEVDAGTSGLLPTLVVYAMRRGAVKVCLDLTELERVDRSGAAALRRCTRAARYAGGRLAMIAPDDPGVAEVLEDSGVNREVPELGRREEMFARTHRPRRRESEPAGATRPRRRSGAR